jgi:hypothetical protein
MTLRERDIFCRLTIACPSRFDFDWLFGGAGETQRQRIHAAIPLRRLLFALQTEGTRMPKHCVDRRVCGPTTSGQDRQLHSHILILILFEKKLGVFVPSAFNFHLF